MAVNDWMRFVGTFFYHGFYLFLDVVEDQLTIRTICIPSP